MITKLTGFMGTLPLVMILLLCLTLGLAPFNPPHIWEKLQMLGRGQLIKPIDWFDLAFHSTPWLLLIIKLGFIVNKK